MRLAAYIEHAQVRWGLVEGEVLVELPEVDSLQQIADRLDSLASLLGRRRPVDGVRLTAPIPQLGRNIFCVGWNYEAHFEEGVSSRPVGAVDSIPERPTFFSKLRGAVVGPYDPIDAHSSLTQSLDWEVELAVIIGRHGRDVPEKQALDHVLGYAVANDISARNVQREHGGQWLRGKSLDGTCPLGPWVTTIDEFDYAGGQAIECRVNGESVQTATLDEMHFDIPRIIAELSAGLSLVPGDVILTGTPSGVGFARTPPRFLKVGDVVESEIVGIGTLRNVVTSLASRGQAGGTPARPRSHR